MRFVTNIFFFPPIRWPILFHLPNEGDESVFDVHWVVLQYDILYTHPCMREKNTHSYLHDGRQGMSHRVSNHTHNIYVKTRKKRRKSERDKFVHSPEARNPFYLPHRPAFLIRLYRFYILVQRDKKIRYSTYIHTLAFYMHVFIDFAPVL